MKYDYLIVGAGYAGAVYARLAADKGLKVLLIDKREHIGGNAYDSYDEGGILIHNYGPHIFHTNSKRVWDFLSQFTKWNYFQHWVLTSVDGQLLPMPINVNTINKLYGTSYNAFNIHEFYESKKKNIEGEIKNSEEIVISQIGEDLYEKFFKNYTKKQWGVQPSELDKSVLARIPIRYNLDPRYFTDKYQAMPAEGYTRMFANILDSKNIEVRLGVYMQDIIGEIEYDKMVYTGKLDEFFDYKHGQLPYRSLQFEFETFDREKYQEAPVINYPNDYDFTRITEYKQLTGQISRNTTISREYSQNEGEPYYPILNETTAKMVEKYKEEVAQLKNVYFIGRLAEYKYYNMDYVVSSSMNKFKEIEEDN
ncbi:MAG: UDP-galactopyranose mutase [Alphaproteobacteria bacterium]|jgi:UDP-galactopyranose mutase|nr:UDP-galactopyranose mutase [Alphaproteobacteria bacterium]